MYKFRNATADDIQRIGEIESLCFPEAEAASLESFQKRFSVFPDCFFVLEVDGLVVGHMNGCIFNRPELPDELYADARLHCPDGDYQTVFGLAVDPKFQRRGYASILTRHFSEVSKKRGHKGIILTCKDYLVPFYKQHGFNNKGKSASSHGGATWNDMLLTH